MILFTSADCNRNSSKQLPLNLFLLTHLFLQKVKAAGEKLGQVDIFLCFAVGWWRKFGEFSFFRGTSLH